MKCHESQMGRRDFVRIAGACSVGVAVSGIVVPTQSYGHEMIQPGSSFRKTATINLDMENPRAITIGMNGNVFVAGRNVVCMTTLEGKESARYAIDGHPHAIVQDTDVRLLIGMGDHILVLDLQRGHAQKWAHLEDNAWITSMATDLHNVYVADAGNRVVLRFDKQGVLINRIGERDPDRDIPGLIVPSPYFDVAIDPMGALWVANPGKHGLESYRPNGELITSWYRPGTHLSAFCGCCNPSYFAFLSNCALVTMEKGVNRVKVLDPDLSLRGLVVGPASTDGLDIDSSCKDTPPFRGIAVTPNDTILLLDEPGRCIHVFEEKGTMIST